MSNLWLGHRMGWAGGYQGYLGPMHCIEYVGVVCGKDAPRLEHPATLPQACKQAQHEDSIDERT